MIIWLRLEHTQKTRLLLGCWAQGKKETREGGDELDANISSAAEIKAVWEILSRKSRNEASLLLFSKYNGRNYQKEIKGEEKVHVEASCKSLIKQTNKQKMQQSICCNLK